MKLKERCMLLHRLVLPLVLATLIAPLAASPVHAGSDIEVMHPWARPTIPNRPGVAYFGIHNLGDTDDRLIGAHAEGVAKIELHKATQKDGVMTMTPVEAVDIPAGGMAHLEPGGFHMMMFGIDPPLKLDDTLEITLIFEVAGEVAITASVSKTMGDQMHHGEGHTGGMKHKHGTTGN
jgi:copper(I)-binding protein